MVKKKGMILTDAAKDDKDKFDVTFEVIQIGDECKRKISVGDVPVFADYVRFASFKVLEKSDDKLIGVAIVHENDIIAVDNEPQLVLDSPSKN
jgi:hypothetical protein